jgi:hypothetical protein
VSFFKRHPRTWTAVWALFGFGGLIMTYNSFFDDGFNGNLLLEGVISIALAAMMIGYLLPELRKTNAPNH